MTDYLIKEEPLKNRIEKILNSENIDTQRTLISTLSAELGIDSLTCAAALLFLTQTIENTLSTTSLAKKTGLQLPVQNASVGVRMVRYRLDVGSKDSVTLEQIKKVLTEESGVDKNNINIVNIQNLYTLIELPDEMPPDIFLHLKSVEINQHKLDIRRVKNRNNKRRGNHHIRRGRQQNPKSGNEVSDQANSKN